MVQLVAAAMSSTERNKKDPKLRTKSYLLQEAEAVSRAAKMGWCAEHGVRVTSIQHDGIMVAHLPAGRTGEDVAAALAQAATAACGYEVHVKATHIGAVPLPVD